MELTTESADLASSIAAALGPLGATREEHLEALPAVFEALTGRPLNHADDYDVAVANATLRLLHPDEREG